MKFPYQIIFLGDDSATFEAVKEKLLVQVAELSMPTEALLFLRNEDAANYKPVSPTFCIYADSGINDLGRYTGIISKLKQDGIPILPLYDGEFNKDTYAELAVYNGESKKETSAIVNHILESFNLLRHQRKIFISYKRTDTREFALELYDLLESRNYNVVLDTHSIHKGCDFQNELWHQMMDSDLVLLLDSRNFLSSNWCRDELAKALSKHITIVRLKFPDSLTNDGSTDSLITITVPRPEAEARTFTPETKRKIVECIEDCRSRALAARQTRIITEFIRKAQMNLKTVTRNDYETLSYRSPVDGKLFYFFPTIGIPDSNDFYRVEIKWEKELEPCDSCFLLYDETDILREWIEHLHWLDGLLKVKSLVCGNFEKWFRNN